MQDYNIKAITAVILPCFILTLLSIVQPASSIGCFVCSSINGSHPDCEDTFNNTNEKYYQPQCHSARKGRMGKFPGTECIKMTAHLGNYTVVVRECTVDSGGVNSDTELGRESHCWMIGEVQFDDKRMKGCTLACKTDGCNNAETIKVSYILTFVCTFVTWLFNKNKLL